MVQRGADVLKSAKAETEALLKDLRFGTVYAFRANAMSAALLLFLSILAALFPVAQVVALARLTELLQNGSPGRAIVPVLLLVVIIVGANGPLISLNSAVEERSMLSTSVAMQVDLVRRAAALPPSRIADAKTVSAIEGHSRAIIDAVAYLYGNFLTGLGSVLSALGVLITLFWLNPVAAALVLAGVFPSLVAGRYVSQAVGRMWQVLGAVYQRDRYLRDMMSRQRSMTELASLGSTERLARAVVLQQEKIESVRNIPIVATIRAQIAVAPAGIFLLGGGVYYAVTQSSSGAVAVASVFAVMAAMAAASAGSVAFGELLQFIPQTTALREFFAATRPAEPIGPCGDRALVSQVEISGLRHVYSGSEVPAVNGVDAEVGRGEMVAFVGVNGAGKTTTINAMLGLIEPTEGTILLDGASRESMGERGWLNSFGLLTQEFGRYEFTVRDTVLFGSPYDHTDDAIWAALEAARAAGFVRALPAGLDTQLGEQWEGVGLSGGQWQRLALARIYLRNAPVWVLDEPTSAIDALAEQEIFEELAVSKQDRITIVVSHRAWTLRGMDRIYVFDQGSVVEVGDFNSLMSRGGAFAEMFAAQSIK